MAERIAARSTTAGTPVKSCSSTRAGVKGTSAPAGGGFGHSASARTLVSEVSLSSPRRSSNSSRTLTVIGSLPRSPNPAACAASREYWSRSVPFRWRRTSSMPPSLGFPPPSRGRVRVGPVGQLPPGGVTASLSAQLVGVLRNEAARLVQEVLDHLQLVLRIAIQELVQVDSHRNARLVAGLDGLA